MKSILIFTTALSCYFLFGESSSKIVFRSEAVHALSLTNTGDTEWILDDNGNEVKIELLEDEDGLIYWYRRLETPVCLTGECKQIDIGIYWKFDGTFLGLEVFGEHLTKSDHSIFTRLDYEKLIQVLLDDWSILREYDYSDLIIDQINDIDGVTRATSKEVADHSVQNAVYTTYAIWHLVHPGEKAQIIRHTLNRLKADNLFKKMNFSRQKEFKYFILEQFALGNIILKNEMKELIINGVQDSEDPNLKELSFKAIVSIALEDLSFQDQLSKVYTSLHQEGKVRLLNSLQHLPSVSPMLYDVLANDLDLENQWFSLKILTVLKNSQSHSDLVLDFVQNESLSENEYFVELLKQIRISKSSSSLSDFDNKP
jgi:hypothetical protein